LSLFANVVPGACVGFCVRFLLFLLPHVSPWMSHGEVYVCSIYYSFCISQRAEPQRDTIPVRLICLVQHSVAEPEREILLPVIQCFLIFSNLSLYLSMDEPERDTSPCHFFLQDRCLFGLIVSEYPGPSDLLNDRSPIGMFLCIPASALVGIAVRPRTAVSWLYN
jgi:hypothetical protein